MADADLIVHAFDTAANWDNNNPDIPAGMLVIESDTNKSKVGAVGGNTAFQDLDYFTDVLFTAVYAAALSAATATPTASTIAKWDSNGVMSGGAPTTGSHLVNKTYADGLISALTKSSVGLSDVTNDAQVKTAWTTSYSADTAAGSDIVLFEKSGTIKRTTVSALSGGGGLSFQNTWNASTNSPNVGATSPSAGHFYIVSVAGTTTLGGISSWAVGDWAVYNGSAWVKIPASYSGATASVQGMIKLAGDLGGTADLPSVVALHFGVTQLTLAAITDGQFVKRSGTTLTGVTPSATDVGLGSVANALQLRADHSGYQDIGTPSGADTLLIKSANDGTIYTIQFSALAAGQPTVVPGDSGWINVRSPAYSANPVGGGATTQYADPQIAIQRAMDDAASSGRPGVLIPAGTYRVSYLVIPYGIRLYGINQESTTITQNTTIWAADGGDSSVAGLGSALGAGIAATQLFPLTARTFTHPRLITISPADGTSDLTDLVFQITGTASDHGNHVISGNPGYSSYSDPVDPGNAYEIFTGPEAIDGVGENKSSRNVYTGNVRLRLVSGTLGSRRINVGWKPCPVVRTFPAGNTKDQQLGFCNIISNCDDATGVHVVETSFRIQSGSGALGGDSCNRVKIWHVGVSGCSESFRLAGGEKDASQPVQMSSLVHCQAGISAPGTNAKHIGTKKGFQFAGQIDSQMTLWTNVVGPAPGLGQPENVYGIAYYWPGSQSLGKSGSGMFMTSVQVRFMKYGIRIGDNPVTGQARSLSIMGADFEDCECSVWAGVNARGVVIQGAFGNGARTTGGNTKPIFYADTNATLIVSSSTFEGAIGTGNVVCGGPGRVRWVGLMTWPSNNPVFGCTVPSVAASSGTVTSSRFSSEYNMGNTNTISTLNLKSTPDDVVLLNLTGATTINNSGNIIVPFGAGSVQPSTFAMFKARLNTSSKSWILVAYA